MTHPVSRPGAVRPGRRSAPVLAGLAAALLAGCASDPTSGTLFGVVRPYRVEVVQGNVVTKEMAAQLREGMSRDQVRGLLGSPLLTDVFHENRWDYVFTIRRQGAEPQQRRVLVEFKEDKVARFEVGELPSERDFVSSIDTAKVPAKPPVLVLTEAQLKDLPLPPKPPAPPAAASGPARTYPPLEPR
jgi:outer membrane protein assembly factor BamE